MFPVGAARLFHFKVDTPMYSIKPEDYGKKPLIFPRRITPKPLTSTVLLLPCVLQVQ
jgi:hypothetical protein